MASGNRLWKLAEIKIKNDTSKGWAWIHLPTQTAYAVKSKAFGEQCTERIHYLYEAFPEIKKEFWEYA